MTTPGERIRQWIESLSERWKDRLRGWMASWLNRGIQELIENLEPEAIELVRDNLAQISSHPATPQNLKDIISTLTAGKKPLPLLLLIPIGVLLLIPTITSIFQPLGNLLRYMQERLFHSWRLDPISVITAWRRDPEKYEALFYDLRDQGWTDDRIDTLKFVTLFYPAPADLVRWQAREVFEPEMVEKYGLDDELGGIVREPFYKAGMTDEQITNYWRAHWEHASWIQVVEMVRRGQMTEKDVWDWFRLIEIPPFWRQKLINISWEVPTRVDVRRFWEYGTIDETRLREIYQARGYHGKDLDDYVLWTKIYTAFPDLMTRFKHGWLTLDDVRSELQKAGMSVDKAEELIQTKVKAVASEKVAKDKDLTAAEIIKGVKKEVITYDQGIELLEELGYDTWEAQFKLAINLEVEAGSPESFDDFKRLTSAFRQATILPRTAMPEELKKAAAEVVRLTNERDALKRSITEEERSLIPGELLPAEATKRLDELKAALRNAEAELARAKTDYQAQLALWRHSS